MNVIFKPQGEQVRIAPEDIIIGGEIRGRIEVYRPDLSGSNYWATIKIEELSPGLLQGTGDTKEAAIVEALERGRAEANLQLLRIQQLEEQLEI